MKKAVAVITVLTVILTVFGVFAPAVAESALPFRDVAEGSWYYPSVLSVWDAGVMNGTAADRFSPEDPMTRGQFVTILSRLSGDRVDGASSLSPFSDVGKEEYYADPVGWAFSHGIARGITKTEFKPDKPVLRQEFAAFFVRFMKYKNITLPEEEGTPFPDPVPAWAADDVDTLRRTGLVKGDGSGRFNGENRMKRAEIATVIDRFLDATAGTPLGGYAVVYAAGYKEAAERIAWQIEKLTGEKLSVLDASSPATDREIVLGRTDRGGPSADGLGETGYEISREGDRFFITGETADGVYRGAAALLKAGSVRKGVFSVPDDVAARVPHKYPVGSLTINGRPISDYSVVCPEDASESVRTGVADLVLYIEKACGFTLPVTSENVSPAIAVDPETVEIDGSYNANEENYSITSSGDDIIIKGSPVRGAMYGCYGFLENHVGWYFLTPEVDYIRPADRVDISGVDETYSPQFEKRENYWRGAMVSEAFSAKNQLNGNVTGEKYGGGINYTGGMVHTMQALTNGRYDQSTQPCLNDEEIYAAVYGNVKKILESNPGARVISVSQNDNSNYCKCEKCAAVAEEEGSEAGNLIRFVNRIAGDLRAEGYDRVSIQTLAYMYTVAVPKTKPDPAVIIQYCTAENCYTHPTWDESCMTHGIHAKNIADWSKVCSRIWVWDYGTHFSNYTNYATNYKYSVLCGNIKYFRDHGVSGMFNQGAYNSGARTGEFSEMRNFLLAKIMEDPDMTEERYSELMNVFLEGYYGVDGAPFIRDYIDRLIEAESRYCDGWMDYGMGKELDRSFRIRKYFDDFDSDFTNAALLTDTAYEFECVSIDRIQLDYIILEYRFVREFGKKGEEVDREIRNIAYDMYLKFRKYGMKMSEGAPCPVFSSPEDITVPPSHWKYI